MNHILWILWELGSDDWKSNQVCHWSFFLNWKSVRNFPIIILTVFESYYYLRVFFNKYTVIFMDHRFNYSKMTCYSL
jgi:hypothetical protein